MWYSKLSHKLIGLQDKKIVDPILSDVFLKKMHKTLKGLRPTHLLLRLFYSDDCCIIEVVPKPNELEAILRSFPVSKPSSEKPHPLFPYHQNQQLLKVFHARRGFTGTLNTNIQVFTTWLTCWIRWHFHLHGGHHSWWDDCVIML